MWKRIFTGCGLLFLAACNLNVTPDGPSQSITGVPIVQIVSPLPNATYLENIAVNIQALVSNAGPDIDRVEFVVDDTVVDTRMAPNAAGVPSFSVVYSWESLGVGAHTLSVIAFRGDGSSSTPANVGITVVGQVGGSNSDSSDNGDSADAASETQDAMASATADAQQSLQVTAAPTNTPAPSNTPEPQDSPTPNVPMATFLTGVNVRRGPSTLFNPPLGGYAANDQSEVLAVHPDGTWYKIRYYNAEGWVHGDLLSISGNTGNLPVDAGPPIPSLTPVPPTPVPATATPNIQVNLVVGNIETDPSNKQCGRTFRIYVDIANFGSDRSPGGSLNVVDTSNGLETRTQGVFGEIGPGDTINVGPIPLTVSTNFSDDHNLTIIVDPGNSISETNENDNRGTHEYRLAKGDC